MKVISALVNVTDTNQYDKTELQSKSLKKKNNIFQKPQHLLLHINGQNLIKKDGKAFLFYGNLCAKNKESIEFCFHLRAFN